MRNFDSEEDALLWLKEHFPTYPGEMPVAIRDTLEDFKALGSSELNAYLGTIGGERDPQLDEKAQHIELIMKRARAPGDLRLWRSQSFPYGFAPEDGPKGLLGRNIAPDGFPSCSMTQEWPFARLRMLPPESVLMELRVPKGCRMLFLEVITEGQGPEMEVLLPYTCQIIATDITPMQFHSYHVTCEVRDM